MKIVLTGVKELRRALDPRMLEVSISRVLNRTTTTAMKEASQAVRGVYAIKAKDIRAHTRIRKAVADDLSVHITIRSKPINMIYFGAKRIVARKKGAKKYFGVSAKIRKDQPRKKYKKRFFIADLGRGERVYMRQGRDRFPLRSVNVISPTTMFRKYGVEKIADVFEREFARRLRADYRYRIDKRMGKI